MTMGILDDTREQAEPEATLRARIASLEAQNRALREERERERGELRRLREARALTAAERSEYGRMKRHFDNGQDGGPFSRHRDSMG